MFELLEALSLSGGQCARYFVVEENYLADVLCARERAQHGLLRQRGGAGALKRPSLRFLSNLSDLGDFLCVLM